MAEIRSGTLWLRMYEGEGHKRRRTHELTCLLGSEPPKVVEGYAIWEQITRPKRKSLTEWMGVRPLKIQISLVIDYFTSNVPNPGEKCEHDMRELEIMAGSTQKGIDEDDFPPILLFDANSQHDDREAGHLRWVMESLEWGQLWWNHNPNGPNIVRAEATIVLMEWVEDQYLTGNGASRNRRARGGGSSRLPADRYRVTIMDIRKGGLKEIARKKLGKPSRWREIANIQKPRIRDPLAIRENQILKMPRRKARRR